MHRSTNCEQPENVTVVYYFLRGDLLTGNSEKDDQFAKHVELLVRIFLNHYHPHMQTLTGKIAGGKNGSLLLLVCVQLLLVLYLINQYVDISHMLCKNATAGKSDPHQCTECCPANANSACEGKRFGDGVTRSY